MMKALSARLLSTAVAALAMAACAGAQAQQARTLRIVVPFSAGGASDLVARAIAERMGPKLGTPVIVENRLGGGGLIAVKAVQALPANGEALLLGTPSVMVILPKITKVDFDPEADFTAVSNLGSFPLAFAVHQSVPARTLAEFVAFAKSRPGKLSFASGGAGTTTHLAPALLFQRAGIELLHVPYKGGAPAVQDLMAGHVQAYFGNLSDFVGHVANPNLRLLGVSSAKPVAELPGVPAIGDTYAGFQVLTWNGLLVRSGTPPELLSRLERAARESVREPAFIQAMAKVGVEPLGTTAAEFNETLRRDRVLWDGAVKAANLKVE